MSDSKPPNSGTDHESNRAHVVPDASRWYVSTSAHDYSDLINPPPRPGIIGEVDRFEIIEEIGRGGMGVVLKAYDPRMNQFVAIKLIQPTLSQTPSAVHRFLNEAKHMQQLEHPNVLQVMEVSEREECPYFVMPFMERGSLRFQLKSGEPLSPTFAASVARDIGQALHFAHEKGITHRDLKIDNVMIDTNGRAHLADFGLARTVFNDDPHDVRKTRREGTLPYMAPEIARGEAGDTRCDIYAWGAMVYEMLTGCPPHLASTADELLQKVANESPTPISARNPAAQKTLAAIAAHAMSRDLADRYASMRHVLEDLDRAKQNKPPRGPHGGRIRGPQLLWIAASVLILAAMIVGVAELILHRRIGRTITDTFEGKALNNSLWTPGQAIFLHPDRKTGTGGAEVTVKNGECQILASSQSPDGWTVRQMSWIDLKENLRVLGDCEIKIVLAKTRDRGVIKVQLSDGSVTDSALDAKSVPIFRVNAPNTTRGNLTIHIRVFPDQRVALVSDDEKWENAQHINLQALSAAPIWWLRLQSESTCSGSDRSNSCVLTVASVRLQTRAANEFTAVFGRLTDAATHEGITAAEVRSTASGNKTRTNMDGSFWLTVPAGNHTIEFKHDDYPLTTLASFMLSPGDRIRRDTQVKPLGSLAGQVVEVVVGNSSICSPGFVVLGSRILCAVDSPDGCRLSELYDWGTGKKAQHRYRAKLLAEGSNQEGRNDCGSAGMAIHEGKIYSIDTWRSRLMILDPDKGVIENRTIEGFNWNYGLAIEGDRFWTLERNESEMRFRLLCFDLKSLKLLHEVETPSDSQSITYGNGKLWMCRGGEAALVLEIDPAAAFAARVLREAIVRRFPGNYTGLSFADGFLWGLTMAEDRYCRIRVGDSAAAAVPTQQP